jgi:hypothetical protein
MSRNKRPFKPRLEFKRHSKRRKPGDVHTIPSFCISNAISESTYHKLKRQGRGPREIEIDGRILITEEAEHDWRLEQERETAERRQREREARDPATATAAAP